jgi:hypothetical protein
MVRCGKRYKSIPTMHALLLEMHRKLCVDMKFRGETRFTIFHNNPLVSIIKKGGRET